MVYPLTLEDKIEGLVVQSEHFPRDHTEQRIMDAVGQQHSLDRALAQFVGQRVKVTLKITALTNTTIPTS